MTNIPELATTVKGKQSQTKSSRVEKWRSFQTEIIGLHGKRPLAKGWSTWHGCAAYMERLERDGHNFGMLARKYPGVDIDVTLSGLADICESQATATFGPAPCRARLGSSKRLLMYRTDELLRKRRFVFRDQVGTDHAVELLATGQQYAVDGKHPDGGSYVWTTEPNPWDLTTITGEMWDRYCRALAERLQRVAGCTMLKTASGAQPSPRPLDARQGAF